VRLLFFLLPCFALSAVLLVLTVHGPAWPGLAAFWGSWVTAGEAAASGGNPSLPPPGAGVNFSNAINFGLVYTGLLGLGYKLGGPSGIALLFEVLAFGEVFVVFLFAREFTRYKRLALWTFLLAFFLPLATLVELAAVQDEI